VFIKLNNKMMKLNTLLAIIFFVNCSERNTNSVGQDSLQLLPSPADTASAQPYLFTDKNGSVFLSWIQKAEGTHLFKFAVLKNNDWSQPITITSGNNWFVNWADYPMIASDGYNNLIGHILQKSADGTFTYDVKLTASSDNGRSWSDLKILHDDGKKAEHGFVSLVPYEEKFFVSWLDGRNTVNENARADAHHDGGHHGDMSLRGAVIDKKGSKAAEWQLDNKVCDCCQTSAAITANGPVVIYRDRSDEEIRDISIVRYVNGNWTEPKAIHPDQWKIAGCPVNGPRSAADGNVLAIAWFTSANEQPRVNLIFSDDGGASFGKPIPISETNSIGRVDVVMLDKNSVMVSWMEGVEIKAMKVHKDGRKEKPITIAVSSDARSSGFPQMTKSDNNLIFAWTDDKEKAIKVAKLVL
jgi:hypothetical protein